MLKHRTNRADVLAAFERYQKLTGYGRPGLLTPTLRWNFYSIADEKGISGSWDTAKEAYLAISRFCDQLEAQK